MSALEETPRLTPTQRLHEVTMAALHRQPAAPESSVEIGVTAKRLHTWTVTVRGVDPEECARVAQRLDNELSAAFAHELENGDDLAGKLAASITAQDAKK